MGNRNSSQHRTSKTTTVVSEDWETTTTTTTTTKWETEVVAAWGKEPDCAPSTGMCDACGLGAVIVEIDSKTGSTSVRSIMTGPAGRRRRRKKKPSSPFNYHNEATFEIASYTKHFTALAMVFLEKEFGSPGKLAKTTLRDWLPCDWNKAWYPGVADITLEELRLHTSGLPPQAPNHDLAGRNGNPFAGYTEDMLCESLLKLTGLPAQGRFVYSNYAYGALGYALTFVVAKLRNASQPPSYEDLIKETVLDPLEMNQTFVVLDKAQWKKAARGCDRGINRGEYAVRRGEYGVLQGNGALRSTLLDMSKFLRAGLLVEGGFATKHAQNFTKMQHILFDAVKILGDQRPDQEEACTCVSGWCEGNLCQLPNPVEERITDSGITLYTSGGVLGRRKSGDTEGFSVRGSASFKKRRGVFVVETCGGCGERGTSGSAAQRVALLLADGPPPAMTQSSESSVCTNEDIAQDGKDRVWNFVGVADSHIYPSFVDLQVEVRSSAADGTATVAVASSDGAGCTVKARPIEDGWEFDTSVLYGCGFGGDDPLATVPQKRSLRLRDSGAILQEMGEDIYLWPASSVRRGVVSSSENTIFAFATVAILFFQLSIVFRLIR